MKKVLLSFALITGLFTALSAQNVIVDKAGNYIAVKRSQDTTTAKETGKTYKDINGNIFKVYISKNGKLFYFRTSKAGNVYKDYSPFKVTN